ncbi:MAG: carboxypeptidase-like regulatory domain-containing protein [Pyrinomonadaceae bacterium]
MKRYVLRLAIAILTFAVGVIVATAFFSRHVPPATIPPSLTNSVVAESPLGREAMLVSQERHAISRRIVGYVKDRENHPVAGAEVCANPHGPVSGIIPRGVSKADGSFTLDIWWPDTYTISAEHLGEGYPKATNGFYGDFFGEAPDITVGESNRLEPVGVMVGPKAGRVVLKILDEQSGRSVESGLVKVCRTDNPQMCMSTSTAFPRGRYELLAPEVPFTIRIGVWGKDWEERDAMGDDGVPVELLQVDLGARKELMIRLRRVQGDR